MRRTADTNILVRAMVDEGLEENRVAMRVLSSDLVVVTVTVLLETEWVLRSIYKATPLAIGNLFARLLGAENISVEDHDAVAEALQAHSAGMDFADALHVFRPAVVGEFLTFDGPFLRLAAQMPMPLPVIRPA